jgi:hypothetical protein
MERVKNTGCREVEVRKRRKRMEESSCPIGIRRG